MATSRLRTRSSAATSPKNEPAPPTTAVRAAPTRLRKPSAAAVEAVSTKPSTATRRATTAGTSTSEAKRSLWASNKPTESQLGTEKARSRKTSAVSPMPSPWPGSTPSGVRMVGGASTEQQQRGSSIGTSYDPAKEPIDTYLRVRPAPLNIPTKDGDSYLKVISQTEIHMIPPLDHRLNTSSTSSSLFSASLPSSPLGSPSLPSLHTTSYKFTHVVPSTSTSQQTFFNLTTLPIVREFLSTGQNSLIFAYGPTGSGKTWTVQGGEGKDRGILPRVLECIWGSAGGRDGDEAHNNKKAGSGKGKASNPFISDQKVGGSSEDPTPIIPIDETYHYSIYVSYTEVYNEKIYDLLQSPLPQPSASTSSTSTPGWSAKAKAVFGLGRSLSTVKRNALSLKSSSSSSSGGPLEQQGKYVSGMKEVKVASVEEAESLVRLGQNNRRVYSTLANRASSRSHSIFTVRIVKTPKGGNAEAAVVSKLSIVDLAGSERVVNTGTTGDRLKEAGNINKSLMVLGQCMEVMRRNQDREKGKKPALVPFRHSKLTELFQNFFVGDGKAVMIVNVNPFETGFDENHHVMKFSAVAKEVMTVTAPPMVKSASAQHLAVPASTSGSAAPGSPSPAKADTSRVVRLSMVEGGEEEDVIYEEEDAEDDDTFEDEFVNALLSEVSELRTALYDSQMRAFLVESQTRAAVIAEYESKMAELERRHEERMVEQALEAEYKMDAKLDVLTRLHAAAQASPSSATYDDSDEYEEDEEDEDEEDEEQAEKMLLDVDAGAEADQSVMTESTELDDSPVAFKSVHRSPMVDSPILAKSQKPHRKLAVRLDDGIQEEGEENEEPSLDHSVEELSREYEVPLEDEEEEIVFTKAKKIVRAARSSSGRKTGRKINDEMEEDDILDLNKSVIIYKGKTEKKSKRKLGGHQVKDSETIEDFTEALGPAAVIKSSSGKIAGSRSSSTRSLRS
ncbi:kinesin-domain-containing protein [Meredithblackwellia eburnea MCA 4105]